jgi:hypothetical protein
MENIIINRGTGAGGANTNKHGLAFEDTISSVSSLQARGFQPIKYGKLEHMFYLKKEYNDTNKVVYYAKKKSFKHLIQRLFSIVMFKEPDEAYLIHNHSDDTYELCIIEIKNQNRDGSVEEKLMTANTVRRMYEKALQQRVKVRYAYSVSNFLKHKLTSNTLKYLILQEIYMEDGIKLFYAEDEDYLQQLSKWLDFD